MYSFVVPVRDKAEVLGEALESVITAADWHDAAEVVVVDDGSSDDSPALIASLAAARRIRAVSIRRRNAGAARNVGAASARGRYLCFVDGDCAVPPDYLDRVLTVLRCARPDAFGYPTRLPAGAAWIAATWQELQQPASEGPTWIPGANMVVARAAFQEVGGFDEKLESYEDVDLCLRLRAAGRVVVAAERLVASHLDYTTSPAEFVRREFRYGLGAFARRHLIALEKVSLATPLHMALVLSGLVCAATAPVGGWLRIGAAVVAAVAVPAAAFAARLRAGARTRHPIRGFFLYNLYFLGRSLAFVVTVLRLTRRRVRRRGRVQTEDELCRAAALEDRP